MEKQRMMSLALVLIVAMLVAMLGKACMSNSTEAKNRNTAASSQHEGPQIVNNFIPPPGYEVDQIEAEMSTQDDNIEYVTDLIGRVVGTVAPTDDGQEEVTEETTEDTRSLLEKYNDEQASIAAEAATAEEQGGAVFGGVDPELTTEIILELG